MNDSSLWRRRLWVWLPALIFLVANVAVFSTYRLVYAGQAEALENRLAEREKELVKVEGRAQELDTLVLDARTNRQLLADLVGDRLSAERQRFTRLVGEIKQLATQSGLDPTQISYPGEEIVELGLTKRYITFNVVGTYPSLREFVRELETTRSFITLEQISLTEGDSSGLLNITLRLSTFFARDPAAPGRATAASGEAAP
jgi:Tfp pilus assembly protein PilO